MAVGASPFCFVDGAPDFNPVNFTADALCELLIQRMCNCRSFCRDEAVHTARSPYTHKCCTLALRP